MREFLDALQSLQLLGLAKSYFKNPESVCFRQEEFPGGSLFHCYQSAVTGDLCDGLTKLPEQTILSSAISLLSEGTQAQHGRVQTHFGGADGKHSDSKIWKA